MPPMLSDASPRSQPYSEAAGFLATIETFARVLAVKLYRMQLDPAPAVPILPCLDHEAMLHEGVPPHAAAYVQDETGDLHEVVFLPRAKRLDVDTVSTLGECSPEAHVRFVARLQREFPGYAIRIVDASRLRGEHRVAAACRAQVSLRDVLTGPDIEGAKAAVARLQTISSLMEKESRVAYWGARTVMTPFIAVAAFLSYQVLGTLTDRLGAGTVTLLRNGIVGVVGAFFVYYGLKAVQLTQMANRMWKRSAEYGLILQERRRL